MYVIIMKVSRNHEQVMKFMTKSNVWLNNWFLTFSWLLDDVWLHVWRLLMSRMGLLMISLNCCSRKGFTFSWKIWWKCDRNKTNKLYLFLLQTQQKCWQPSLSCPLQTPQYLLDLASLLEPFLTQICEVWSLDELHQPGRLKKFI